MSELQPVRADDYSVQIKEFENGLINFLEGHNLPAENIFVQTVERIKVFRNLGEVLDLVDGPKQE